MSTTMIIPRQQVGETRHPARLNGRCIWAVEDRTLKRTIVGSRHLLRHPPGIAFDAAEYDRLRLEFDRMEVTDRETGIVYRLSAKTFDEKRELIDRGHGLQYLVRLEHWEARQGPYQRPLPL